MALAIFPVPVISTNSLVSLLSNSVLQVVLPRASIDVSLVFGVLKRIGVGSLTIAHLFRTVMLFFTYSILKLSLERISIWIGCCA